VSRDAPPAPAAEAAELPARRGSDKRRGGELAAEYLALDERERLRFAKATRDALPVDVLSDAMRSERLDYPGAEIRLRVTTKAERVRLKACAKEPFTIEWIHRCVRAGDVLYDIGANVGAYSLVAAKQPGGGARVFAFEPSYANVAALTANVVLNGLAGQVTPMPIALSNQDAMTVFGLRALEAGSARHTLGTGPSDEGPPVYRQPVMTMRVDALVERFGLPQPNHIKLDVDGGELEVLEGATRALASPELRSMLVEVSTSLSAQVTDILERHGLHLDGKVNVQNKAGEYRVWYGLFTRGAAAGANDRVQVQHVAR
jgi:FkbM family methyltransferase